jgi:hypothetical protein
MGRSRLHQASSIRYSMASPVSDAPLGRLLHHVSRGRIFPYPVNDLLTKKTGSGSNEIGLNCSDALDDSHIVEWLQGEYILKRNADAPWYVKRADGLITLIRRSR